MIDELVKTMAHINPLFDRKRHMPCLAHVLNLAVQDGLKDLKTTADEDTSTSCILSSKSLGDVVSRVRKIVKVIRSSPARVEKYEQFCHDLGISSTSMPNLDISTRWNSTYDMLSEAYEKKMVLEKMAMFVLTGRPNEHYLISNEEWHLVSDFTTVLEPLRDVTQLLCQSKQVTASTTLLLIRAALETMKEHEECLHEGQLFPEGIILDYMQHNSIISACMAMTDKLAKYEERLQGSNAFAIATVLDLQLKLNYIPACNQENLKVDICKALQEVQDEGNQAILHSIETIEPNLVSSDILKGSGNKILSRVGRMTKPAAMRPISYIHELHAYLQQATVEEDALTWWKVAGYRAYPKIAILAKDFLSICATSAPAERFFSSG